MLDKDDVLKAANNAMIELNKEEVSAFLEDFNSSMNSIVELKEKEIDNCEPLVYLGRKYTVLRDEVIQESLGQEKLFKNAPQSEDNFFIVPKVVD